MFKSILWKSRDESKTVDEINFPTISSDLKLNKILTLMSKEPEIKMTSEIFLNAITNNQENILYRQCILQDFIQRKDISTDLADLVILIDKMQVLHKILRSEFRVPSLMLRLKKLELYQSIMQRLEYIFTTNGKYNVSDDFSTISSEIKLINKTKNLDNLKKDIAEIKELLRKSKSLDIGANIDDQDLREAVIISVNNFKYDKSNIIEKISSSKADGYDRKSIAPEIDISNAGQLLIFENELFRDFDELLNKDLIKIDNILKKHKEIVTSDVLTYRDEICLYFGAVRIREFLISKGFECCFPTNSKATVLIDLYSIHILLEKLSTNDDDKYLVVKNSVSITEDEEVLLITGPNNGGKTVLLETMTLLQLLYQNGMSVPSSEGALPIYEKIFTHFPKDEDISKGTGRLGEEAVRVSNILKNAKVKTLAIFNEPYITTSPLEGLDILANSISKFRQRGIMMYLVTHYLDILNEIEDPNGIASYVLEHINGNRTFKANKMLPLTDSHAMDVAKAHGVDFEGIMKLIAMRNSDSKAMEENHEITI